MGDWIRSQIRKLSGTRKFAAGALALFVVSWLTERALTLLWEKLLEKQAPLALRQMSDLFATDLVIGMAIMAILVLFVPPAASFLFDLSARLARMVELRNKRMSRRDYIAKISTEAIQIAQEARGISTFGRWDYDDPSFVGMSGQEAWDARERKRVEQGQEQAQALQTFVRERSGRARFLMTEFVGFGYAKEIPYVFDSITNYFCVAELGNVLEETAHRARSDLERDGFPISPTQAF